MKASFKAEDDVFLITGGANGICRELAIQANVAGAKVAVLDIAKPPSDLPDVIDYLQVDVSDRAAVFSAVDRVADQHGPITGLVCGAVIQPRESVLETSEDLWRRIQAVNLDGTLWSMQAVVPTMVERQRGSVIVFTSGLAASGWPGASGYATTKAAVTVLAKTLAAEVIDSRVRVNVVAPRVIETEQYQLANSEKELDHWRKTIGSGEPEDVVGPLLFLLSDEASLTGSMVTRERAYRRYP